MRANTHQLGDAVRDLTTRGHLRLHETARILLPGTSYIQPLDLLGDALAAAFHSTDRQDNQCWHTDVPLESYLIAMILTTAATHPPTRAIPLSRRSSL
jgi:hypothetical protein